MPGTVPGAKTRTSPPEWVKHPAVSADGPAMRVAFALGVACLGLAAGASTAAAVPVQPGAFVEVGSHPCTLGFVFDGMGGADGREFITTAAHCVDNVGQHALDGRGTTIGRVVLVGPASA